MQPVLQPSHVMTKQHAPANQKGTGRTENKLKRLFQPLTFVFMSNKLQTSKIFQGQLNHSLQL